MYFRAKSETKGSGSHWYESNVPLDFKLWSVKSLVCFTALHVRVNWKPIKEFIQEAATHFWSLDYFSRWFRSVSTFASSLVWHPSSPQSSYPSCHSCRTLHQNHLTSLASMSLSESFFRFKIWYLLPELISRYFKG